jgi:hypothetical protein
VHSQQENVGVGLRNILIWRHAGFMLNRCIGRCACPTLPHSESPLGFAEGEPDGNKCSDNYRRSYLPPGIFPTTLQHTRLSTEQFRRVTGASPFSQDLEPGAREPASQEGSFAQMADQSAERRSSASYIDGAWSNTPGQMVARE